MLVTLFGIVMLVRLVQPRNAQSPMLLTGRPLVVLGMVNVVGVPEDYPTQTYQRRS